MSEEPSTGEAETAPPRRPWWRRKPVAIGVAAGLVVGVVVAVVVAGQPAQRQEHAELPAGCTMVTAATLTRYLPDAGQGGLTDAPVGQETHLAGCLWSSYTLGGTRDLALHVGLFRSPAAASAAERAHFGLFLLPLCPCPGLSITTQAVPGLGDQARAAIMTVKTTATATGPAWSVPQIGLVVRSGNAIIQLSYIVSAGLHAPPKPATATLVADTVAIAHDVLAAVTGKPSGGAAAPPAYASPRGLLYARPRNPCGLVKASTLARYAPGITGPGTSKPATSASGLPPTGNCLWTGGVDFVNEFVTVYSHPGDAQSGIVFDVQTARKYAAGKFIGTQQAPDLGDQATAVFITDGIGQPEVDLYVSEANAGLEMIFLISQGPSPSRAAMLAADIAMARDVLADLPRS